MTDEATRDEADDSPQGFIRIRAARTHNLKNVDLDIPHDKLVVITGPSGSGKSSLAFDTLYAEGQRQYFESLSPYARQFLDQLERPDVDLIEGLRPTIAIDQRPGSHNRRSTVATVTEIYDYLRLLMARLGEAFCYRCGMPIRQRTSAEIVADVISLGEGTKAMILAPYVRGRKGQHKEVFDAIRKAGFVRARVDGLVHDLDGVPELAARKAHHVEAVVDRVVVRQGIEPRLAESINLALRRGDGLAIVSYLPSRSRLPGGTSSREPSEEAWHETLFNTEYACPDCKISYEELEPRTFSFSSPYGACPACEGLGVRIEADSSVVACPECGGARLRPEARSVRLGGKAIHEITALTVTAARGYFASLNFAPAEAPVADKTVGQIAARLEFLDQVGLDYLSLDRAADTLSGGESQRMRLATGIGAGLVSVCYVLDEPSIGLHQRDNERLIAALRRLQDLGNSVLVVEHDEAIMREADYLIDMGPGAGREGGRVVAQGTPDEVRQDPRSLTGRYLSGELSIPVPAVRRETSPERAITLEGAAAHNLKQIDVRFPLAALVCVTGVSGSGKSSLVNDTLARALALKLTGGGPLPGPFRALSGADQIDKLVEVDQSPVGRTPRSNPATYTGIFDEIRKVFAKTRESRQRGYRAGRFSFNAPGGRCEECQGHGFRKIAMNFLPDLYVVCPVCQGKRFNAQTLLVRFKGRSIADVLDLRVAEALAFFENFLVIHRMLASLAEVGLGYITLGQPATTLSGGESQRIKLAAELGRVDTGRTLYILDEPTTGLHLDDIKKLLDVLQRLVDRGNTIIVIEHQMDVIKCADWIIDLGPEGGEAGGRIVATGTPEQIAALPDNHTGRWLRKALSTPK